MQTKKKSNLETSRTREKSPRVLPSFLKGLRVFQCVASQPGGSRLTDVARMLALAPSNATLYLNTLMEAGFLARDPLTRHYVLSPATAEWLQVADNILQSLMTVAEGPMEALHHQLNENVLLAVRKGRRVMFMKHFSANRRLHVRIEPEPDYPLHMTAAGRAILAFLPDHEIKSYLSGASFPKLTKRTVPNVKALRCVLDQTRTQDMAVNDREYEDEIIALAVPIRLNDYPVASLVVQFPSHRYTATQAQTHMDKIRHAACAIEKALHVKSAE